MLEWRIKRKLREFWRYFFFEGSYSDRWYYQGK